MDIYGSQMKRPNDVGDRFSSSTMMTLMFVDMTVWHLLDVLSEHLVETDSHFPHRMICNNLGDLVLTH